MGFAYIYIIFGIYAIAVSIGKVLAVNCYLSFGIGSIAFIFLVQAVIVYLTMFKKFECDTGTKVGKSIVFSLISTPFYSILLGASFAFFFPYSAGIPILMIIGLFIYCITSYR